MGEHFTLLRLSINEVFNAFKDKPWVKPLKSIQYNPTLLRAEEYCSYHDSKETQDCPLQKLTKIYGRTCPPRIPQRIHSLVVASNA